MACIVQRLALLGRGIDIVMIKPALGYLNVVHAVAEVSLVSVAAYQVSGEYAWLDRERTILGTLTGIRHAQCHAEEHDRVMEGTPATSSSRYVIMVTSEWLTVARFQRAEVSGLRQVHSVITRHAL